MPTRRISSDLDRLVTLLFSMSRQMRERLHYHESPDGLSMVQLGTLHMISEMSAPTMGKMAECLFITRPSATSLINSLVRSGYLKRVYDSRDGRSVRLVLTSKGKRVERKALNAMRRRLRDTLGVLSPNDIKHLYAILIKLTPTS